MTQGPRESAKKMSEQKPMTFPFLGWHPRLKKWVVWNWKDGLNEFNYWLPLPPPPPKD